METLFIPERGNVNDNYFSLENKYTSLTNIFYTQKNKYKKITYGIVSVNQFDISDNIMLQILFSIIKCIFSPKKNCRFFPFLRRCLCACSLVRKMAAVFVIKNYFNCFFLNAMARFMTYCTSIGPLFEEGCQCMF